MCVIWINHYINQSSNAIMYQKVHFAKLLNSNNFLKKYPVFVETELSDFFKANLDKKLLSEVHHVSNVQNCSSSGATKVQVDKIAFEKS